MPQPNLASGLDSRERPSLACTRPFFKVSRGWRACLPDYEFSIGDAWVWLLEEAAYRPRTVCLGGRPIDLDTGQVAASLRTIADAWGWNHIRVRRFLHSRQRAGALTLGVTPVGLVISLCDSSDIPQKSPANPKPMGGGVTPNPRLRLVSVTPPEPQIPHEDLDLGRCKSTIPFTASEAPDTPPVTPSVTPEPTVPVTVVITKKGVLEEGKNLNPPLPPLGQTPEREARSEARCARWLADNPNRRGDGFRGNGELDLGGDRGREVRSKRTHAGDKSTGQTPDTPTPETPPAKAQETIPAGSPEATPKPPVPKDYVFAGKIIKLTQADYEIWKTRYRHVDLRKTLGDLDEWLSRKGLARNWYQRVSVILERKQAEALDAYLHTDLTVEQREELTPEQRALAGEYHIQELMDYDRRMGGVGWMVWEETKRQRQAEREAKAKQAEQEAADQRAH